MTEVVKFKTGTPTDYDPAKGLKTIAVSEAAEKHFARAKDTEGLYAAVETKIDEQAKYIVWRDSVMKVKDESVDRDADSGKFAVVAEERTPQLPDDDPGKDVAYRWRDRFTMKQTPEGGGKAVTIINPGKIAEAKEEAKERCRQICEQEGGRGPGGTAEREARPEADLERIERARERWAEDEDIEIKDNAKIKDIDGGFEITMVGTVYE